MTEPTGVVQIKQSDIDTWTAAVTAAATSITTATNVLSGYITTLLAGQNTALPAADEAGVNAAVTALQTAGTALAGLEPPTTHPTFAGDVGAHEVHDTEAVSLSSLPSLSVVTVALDGLTELLTVAEALDPSQKALLGTIVSLLDKLKTALAAV
jgi:hypothetical protein